VVDGDETVGVLPDPSGFRYSTSMTRVLERPTAINPAVARILDDANQLSSVNRRVLAETLNTQRQAEVHRQTERDAVLAGFSAADAGEFVILNEGTVGPYLRQVGEQVHRRFQKERSA